MALITNGLLTINNFTIDVKETGFREGYFTEYNDEIKFFLLLDKTYNFYTLNLNDSENIQNFVSNINLSLRLKHYFLGCLLEYIENETDHQSYSSEGYKAYRSIQMDFFKIEIRFYKENSDFVENSIDFDKRVKRHFKVLPTLEEQLYKLQELTWEFQKHLPNKDYELLIVKCQAEIDFINFQIKHFEKKSLPPVDGTTIYKSDAKVKVKKIKKHLTLLDIFDDPSQSSIFLEVLRKLSNPIIDDKNTYIFTGIKGIVSVIYNFLKKSSPKKLSKLTLGELSQIFNDTFPGFNLTSNGSEFTKFYNRLDYNKLEIEMECLFSKFSQKESPRK